MGHNVEISDPVRNVSYENPEEDFSESFIQTYVHYQKDENHSAVKKKGVRRGLLTLAPATDKVIINEDFLASKHWFNSNDDAVSINEIFDARKTQEILFTVQFGLEVLEDFAKEHIPAIRVNTEDDLTILEAFTKEVKRATRFGVNDEVVISEDFSKDLVATIQRSTEDSLTINEDFNSYLTETIDLFREDSLAVNESFSKDVEYALRPPENVSAASNGDGTITISWDLPKSGEPHEYQLQYQVDGGNWNVENNDIPGDDRAYTHDACADGVNDDQIVTYRMRSEDVNGNVSDWSNKPSEVQVGCDGGGGQL